MATGDTFGRRTVGQLVCSLVVHGCLDALYITLDAPKAKVILELFLAHLGGAIEALKEDDFYVKVAA